jgi:hypothetical protein
MTPKPTALSATNREVKPMTSRLFTPDHKTPITTATSSTKERGLTHDLRPRSQLRPCNLSRSRRISQRHYRTPSPDSPMLRDSRQRPHGRGIGQALQPNLWNLIPRYRFISALAQIRPAPSRTPYRVECTPKDGGRTGFNRLDTRRETILTEKIEFGSPKGLRFLKVLHGNNKSRAERTIKGRFDSPKVVFGFVFKGKRHK